MKNKWLFLLCILFLFTGTIEAQEVTVDGYDIWDFYYTSYYGFTSAPAVSESGEARLYYNYTDNKFYISKDAGAYSELGAGSGSGDEVTVNGTAVDTTANFKDNTDITFTFISALFIVSP